MTLDISSRSDIKRLNGVLPIPDVRSQDAYALPGVTRKCEWSYFKEGVEELTLKTVNQMDASSLADPGRPTAMRVPPARRYSMACWYPELWI
jgi:hypothetical protein